MTAASLALIAACSRAPANVDAAAAKPVSFDQLMRDPSGERGKPIRLYGKIAQAIADGSGYQFRIDVEPDQYGLSTHDVLVEHYEGPRLLEGDVVDILGLADGTVTYKAVLGNQIEIPAVQLGSMTLSTVPWPTFDVPSF
jgi:hypothetical protein